VKSKAVSTPKKKVVEDDNDEIDDLLAGLDD